MPPTRVDLFIKPRSKIDSCLYLSVSPGKTSIGIEGSALLAEPSVFPIRPDQNIYYLSVS